MADTTVMAQRGVLFFSAGVQRLGVIATQSSEALPSFQSFPAFETLTPELKRHALMLLLSLGALALLSLLDSSGKAKLASSRWATKREQRRAKTKALRQVRQQAPNKVALTVGTPGHKATLHFPDLQRGLAVVGAPGSGKSYSIINPLTLSAVLQGLPILLYDYKYPKQASNIAPLARSLGYDVHVFAPGFSESACCNPLDFMRSDTDITMARQLATVFYSNAVRGQGKQVEDSYFTNSGISAMVGGLTLAKSSDHADLAMVHALLRLPNLPECLQQATAANRLPLWATLNFDQLTATADSERTTASIISTAVGYLSRLMAPDLLNTFVGTTTLPLKLESRQLIILGVDKERRHAVGPLLATVLHLLIQHNMTTARSAPLVTVLDEFPTLYLPSLVQWINEYRDQGLALILGFQNLAQLEQSYGPVTARAIFGACASKVIFNPGEAQSAQAFAQYLGDEEIRYTETSRSRSHGRTSTNRQPQRRTRRLFDPAQFLKLPTGNAVVISPGIGSGKEGSIPVKTRIHVPPPIRSVMERSSSAWDALRSSLLAAHASSNDRSQHTIDDAALQARFDLANTLLPDVSHR